MIEFLGVEGDGFYDDGRFTSELGGFLRGATGDFEDEFYGEGGGVDDTCRIDSALETVGGIRSKSGAAGGAADALRCELGGLQQNVSGGPGHAAGEAAHDASEGEHGAGFV